MAYEAYLKESGTGHYLVEGGVGVYILETSTGEAPSTASADAGRPRVRRQRYILRFDGEEFVCKDLAAAIQVLERAKALAKKVSQDGLKQATETKKAPKLKEPKIEAESAELEKAVEAAREEIKEVYRKTNLDMELLVLLHEQMLRDEDEELMWLM